MRKQLSTALALVTAMMALSTLASAQNFAKVQGKVTDEQGNIIVGAQVQMSDKETGRKYTLKTDKKGQYFSIGIAPGTYNMVLVNNGQELWHFDNVPIRPQPNDDPVVLDFDLKKEKGGAPAAAAAPTGPPQSKNAPKRTEMSEEQKKEMERVNKENEKIAKENEKIKGLNQLLAQARSATQAGNYDQAVTVLNQATQADPNRDLLWGSLGDAYLGGAKKETEPTAKKEKYTQAAGAYKKAVDLASASTDPRSKTALGSYYNNLGEALARSGQNDQAIAAYKAATAAEPTNAMFQYNLGATLININKADDAVAAFDQAIALKPDMANAYYYKGIALLGKASIKGDKMVPVPGTAEAFNKYLELQPDGPEAQSAKEMLNTIGAPVQTKFNTKKK
jgi:tetratricopeptide (TPR) repeat protein